MSKKCILVVEDSPIATKMVKCLFELLGCEVDCTDDGDKAIAMALKNKYDGICMDIGLPTVSGIDACKAIRAYEVENHMKPVPIIALTANSRPEEVTQYLEVGMQDVFSKPFTKDKAEKFLCLCKDNN